MKFEHNLFSTPEGRQDLTIPNCNFDFSRTFSKLQQLLTPSLMRILLLNIVML